MLQPPGSGDSKNGVPRSTKSKPWVCQGLDIAPGLDVAASLDFPNVLGFAVGLGFVAEWGIAARVCAICACVHARMPIEDLSFSLCSVSRLLSCHTRAPTG